MDCGVVEGPDGAAAGVAGGLGGATRTRFCAVAQVATQRSWALGWASMRPRPASWANTRTGIQRCVTVHSSCGEIITAGAEGKTGWKTCYTRRSKYGEPEI